MLPKDMDESLHVLYDTLIELSEKSESRLSYFTLSKIHEGINHSLRPDKEEDTHKNLEILVSISAVHKILLPNETEIYGEEYYSIPL